MPDFVYDIPSGQLALFFSLAAVAAVVIGLLVVKPSCGPVRDRARLQRDPEFRRAGFNLFYGLLLGLLTVAAYQNTSTCGRRSRRRPRPWGRSTPACGAIPNRSAERRADACSAITCCSRSTRIGRRTARARSSTAATTAPMPSGRGSPATSPTRRVRRCPRRVIGSYQDFTEARQGRLAGVITEIPDVLWYAVLVGALVSVLLFSMLKMRIIPAVPAGHHHLVLSWRDPLRHRVARRSPAGGAGAGTRRLRTSVGAADGLGRGARLEPWRRGWLSSRCGKWKGCGRSASTSTTRPCGRGPGRCRT